MIASITKSIKHIFKQKDKPETKYSPLIIAGASGAGKGTFVKMLQQAYPDKFALSVSWTTRPMRSGEENGKQYFFKSKEEFLKEIENQGFLEYCIVHENLYGTSKQFIEDLMEKKKICILEIDVKGAEKVHKVYPNSLYVHIKCKSFDILEERLRNRKSDSEEQIQIRLKNSIKEVEELDSMKHFKSVVNDDLQESFKEFEKIILDYYIQMKEQKK